LINIFRSHFFASLRGYYHAGGNNRSSVTGFIHFIIMVLMAAVDSE
jgi:hypothetical protein